MLRPLVHILDPETSHVREIKQDSKGRYQTSSQQPRDGSRKAVVHPPRSVSLIGPSANSNNPDEWSGGVSNLREQVGLGAIPLEDTRRIYVTHEFTLTTKKEPREDDQRHTRQPKSSRRYRSRFATPSQLCPSNKQAIILARKRFDPDEQAVISYNNSLVATKLSPERERLSLHRFSIKSRDPSMKIWFTWLWQH